MTPDLDVAADDFGQEPWLYPGKPVRTNALLTDGRLQPLLLASGRRLGQARTIEHRGVSDPKSLGRCLLESNAAAIDARHLVLAVGSNASAAVMHRKFRDAHVSSTFPFLVALTTGIGVGHSAHISPSGYIAAAPFAQLGRQVALRASLFDKNQLEALNATESNYTARVLDEQAARVLLDNGEVPSASLIYDSNHGLLTRPALDDEEPTPLPLMPQEKLCLFLIKEIPELRRELGCDDPRKIMKRWASSSDLREATREILHSTGWSRPSGLASSPSAQFTGSVRVSTYGRQPPVALDPPEGLRVTGSPDESERQGEQVVVLSPRECALLGRPSHVAIQSSVTPIPPLTAKLLSSETLPDGVAGVDQLLRNSLGIELQERVQLSPTKPPQKPLR